MRRKMLHKVLMIVICCFTAYPVFANSANTKQVMDKSALQKRLHKESKALKYPVVLFYKPNYILPYYNTGSPLRIENRQVKKSEFKYQFSFQLPLWRRMLVIKDIPISLYIAYTQLSYWQFYVKSQYFRETNYDPQIFLSSNFRKNWLARLGLEHTSNGRGEELERSWNRLFFNLNYSTGPWLFSAKPWILIFKKDSSDLHNPDIATFLGHERFLVAYKFNNDLQLSLQLRNVERIKYSAITAALSYPITKHFKLYLQLFNGYGQSLIEYNKKTTSFGVGIALNDWI